MILLFLPCKPRHRTEAGVRHSQIGFEMAGVEDVSAALNWPSL